MAKQGMTIRVARWSARHPWQAVIGWIVFVVLSFAAQIVVGTQQITTSDGWNGESGRGETIIADAGITRPLVEKVLISAKSGQLDTSAANRAADEVRAKMSGVPGVSSVGEPRRSEDGTALLVPVTLQGNDVKAAKKNTIPPLLEATKAIQEANSGLRIEQTGDLTSSVQLNRQISSDLLTGEAITLPLTLVILFLVFGGLLVAGVPVLLAITSFLAAMGLSGLASHLVPDAGVASVVLMMGMAVGVDYSLFYVRRVREERLRRGAALSHLDAVEIAARTSGHVILVSGFAVIVSLLGLFIADDAIFSSIAVGSLIVVAVAMFSSLTVLPALLAKLAGRVHGGRRKQAKLPQQPSELKVATWWPALLRPALHHPVVTLVAGVLVMIALMLPVIGIKLSVEGKDTFPKSIPAITAYDRMTDKFPDEGVAHSVVVQTTPARADEARAVLNDLSSRLRGDRLFAPPSTPDIRVSADGTVSVLRVPVPFGSNSPEAKQSLEKLRGELVPATVGAIQDTERAVAGEVAMSVDYVSHQAERAPLVVAFVLLLTLLTMGIAFRSVIIGVVGVLLNLLSAGAAFGVLTFVFQYQWETFGLPAGGFITSRIPLIVFVILFGLSMDYQIFVVSRIHEAVKAGLPTREAVYRGITTSASTVTSAAIIMVSVFASFTLSQLMETKQIGFGLAVAVLLDAVIVRIVILPAVMTLLGRATWWPSKFAKDAAVVSPTEATRPLHRPVH